MNNAHRMHIPAAARILVLALAWLAPAAPVQAFDLGAPVKLARRVLGQKPPADAPDRTGAKAGAGDPALARPSTPAFESGTAASSPAPSDSVDAGTLDNILLSPDPYYYQAFGRRDPFVSLVSDDWGNGSEDPPSGKLTVRGILWGDNDRFALVETGEGENYILRQGDRCGRFTVTRIEPEGITVYWSEYGVGKSQRLPLIQGKGSKDERGTR